LRTLCLAYKEVAEDAYEEWESQHHEACLLLQNRAKALHQVYNNMEQNLEVGGHVQDGGWAQRSDTRELGLHWSFILNHHTTSSY
jgi:hypothetical protein